MLTSDGRPQMRTQLGAYLRAFMVEDRAESRRRRHGFDDAGGGDEE
jgi:hypothetical protein